MISLNGETCEFAGCTDPSNANYDPKATFDDGSCDYPGCMDPNAYNFDQAATSDDGTYCEFLGCTDSSAENYDPTATFDDGSCHYWTPDTFEDAAMDPAMMNGDWTAAGGR